jgi:hypothetical protein
VLLITAEYGCWPGRCAVTLYTTTPLRSSRWTTAVIEVDNSGVAHLEAPPRWRRLNGFNRGVAIEDAKREGHHGVRSQALAVVRAGVAGDECFPSGALEGDQSLCAIHTVSPASDQSRLN